MTHPGPWAAQGIPSQVPSSSPLLRLGTGQTMDPPQGQGMLSGDSDRKGTARHENVLVVNVTDTIQYIGFSQE